MNQIYDIPTLRAALTRARCDSSSIGLVPTMGALHEGHLSLARAARVETDLVVMSLFVNPTQFGPSEDFEQYPRDVDRDRELASAAGVDLLFAPGASEMYPDGPASQQIWVLPGPLGGYLDGASRPGHFRGVATVVTKLFAIIDPHRAYFGQKDVQQALIIQRLARDLGFSVNVRILPIVRESDGLALSSRNVYLTPEERMQAPSLYAALGAAREALERGERRASAIESIMRDLFTSRAPRALVDYATVADLETLRPIEGMIGSDVVMAVAVYFGKTRLIDNVIARFQSDSPDFS